MEQATQPFLSVLRTVRPDIGKTAIVAAMEGGDLDYLVKNNFTKLPFQQQLKIKSDGRPTPKLDLQQAEKKVGGAVREVTGYTATFRQTIVREQGGTEGDCLHVRRGYHHVIQDFPNCVVCDGVINFFLARTEKVRQVGFDPQLARVAHLEFFIDGLGSLHVGSCDDVIVSHASKIKLPWGQSESSKAYAKFRYPPMSYDVLRMKEGLLYFKNGIQCMSSNP